MNKKETFKQYVRRVFTEIKRYMYLHEYSYSIVWSTEDKGNGALADILVDNKYLNFRVTIYPSLEKYFDEGNYIGVTETLLHELCHVYTEPMYDVAITHCPPALDDQVEFIREQGTQRITGAILPLLPKSLKKLSTK